MRLPCVSTSSFVVTMPRTNVSGRSAPQSGVVPLYRKSQTNRTTPARCIHPGAAPCNVKAIDLSQLLRRLPDLRHQLAPPNAVLDQGSRNLRRANSRTFVSRRQQTEYLVFDSGIRHLIDMAVHANRRLT